MSQVLKVLGMEIPCSYADELIDKIKRQQDEEGLYTYGVISGKFLMEAQEDVHLRRYLDFLDGSVVGEAQVLTASNLEDAQLKEEVESFAFPKDLLVFLTETQHAVFILGETQEEAQGFADYLQEAQVDFPVVGVDYLDVSSQDNIDRVINEINTYLPAMVLAFGQNLTLERFVLEHRKKMNTKYWISLGGIARLAEETGAKSFGWLTRLFEKAAFRKLVNKYNNENGGTSL